MDCSQCTLAREVGPSCHVIRPHNNFGVELLAAEKCYSVTGNEAARGER